MDITSVNINHVIFRAWEEGDTETPSPAENTDEGGVELTMLRFRAWESGDA